MAECKPPLLFYTTATRHYLPFLPIYVYFASLSNPGATFEFVVDDVAECERIYRRALAFLREEMGVEIHLSEPGPDAPRVAIDNTYRFVLEPQCKADFVYIGDVDIMIVEDVWEKHKTIFEKGLPYSNIVRPNSIRLSGLHFTRYDALYPLPRFDDILEQHENDEEVLYQIVKRQGHLARQPEIDAVGIGRPQHGIHMSLNRIPFSDAVAKLQWGIGWDVVQKYQQIMSREDFLPFVSTLPFGSRRFLANLYFIQQGVTAAGRDVFSLFERKDDLEPVSKGVFTEIFKKDKWRGGESRSGPSSNLARTETLRAALPGIVERLGVKRFLDAPCGDFFWMKSLAPDLPVSYLGGDIVEELIVQNKQNHDYENVEFRYLDLVGDDLPGADMLFCRDFLFHLSYADIAKVLENFAASDCGYLMTTSHMNRDGFENRDIPTGGWRWFDLFKPPFNFPDCYIEQVVDGGGDRYMYVWRKEDLSKVIKNFAAEYLGE